MRRPLIAALAAAGVLALTAAGCGSGEADAPQVPGAPADVTIPDGEAPEQAAASAQDQANSDSSSSSDDSTSSDDTSSSDTGTSDSTTGDTGTTGDTSGGTAAPDTGTDSAGNDTAPPAGSNAEQFEDFCAQNQGAC
jgi:hypothetical protein